MHLSQNATDGTSWRAKQLPLLCRPVDQVLNAAGAAGGHKPINMTASWLVQPADQMIMCGLGGTNNNIIRQVGWFSRSVRFCVAGAAGRGGWPVQPIDQVIHDVAGAAYGSTTSQEDRLAGSAGHMLCTLVFCFFSTRPVRVKSV